MGRLLVVDDNELVGKVATHYLSRYGWQVETVNTPFGVLNKIRELKPDVILLDINMPGLSGGRVAQLINGIGIKEKQGFKVILFSTEDAKAQEEMVKSGLVDGYFLKSKNLDGLQETIQKVLRKEPLAA